jgi:hypothetical protein
MFLSAGSRREFAVCKESGTTSLSIPLWRENLLVAPFLPAKSNAGFFCTRPAGADGAGETSALGFLQGFFCFSTLYFQFFRFYFDVLFFSGFLV